jgi:hypothetical protein
MLCPNGNDSVQLSISGWPNHTWGNGSTAESIIVTAPGTYSVTVGTGYGHTLQLNYEVQMASVDNFVINRTPALCAGDSTGLIEVVQVNSGQAIFTMDHLAAGNYSVPITFFEGCVVEQQAIIEEPLPFSLQVDSIANTCFGYSNGAALVRGIEGTAPYSGFNDTGFLYLNNLLPGNYIDTITDANGCAATYSFEIAEIPGAIIEVTSPNWVCPGGWVVFDATVTGVGSSYFWDVIGPGTILGAGTQSFSVVDSFQCVTTIDVVIEEISAPTIDATIASESVLGLGSLTLNVVGNYPPYTATWQSGFVGLNYNGLAQGNYNVAVSDSLGCVIDTAFTVVFDFVEVENSSSAFIIDWKVGQLKYTGSERLFEVEVFDAIGQLLATKSSLGSNEIIHLNVSPQMIFVSSSKGKSRTKILIK